MVVPMPDNTVDPSGNTEAFRAFTERVPAEPPSRPNRMPLIIGGVVVLVIVVAVVVWAVS